MARGETQANNKSVQIDHHTHASAKRYSEKTGIPMTRIIAQAVRDWMVTTGAQKLKDMKGKKK